MNLQQQSNDDLFWKPLLHLVGETQIDDFHIGIKTFFRIWSIFENHISLPSCTCQLLVIRKLCSNWSKNRYTRILFFHWSGKNINLLKDQRKIANIFGLYISWGSRTRFAFEISLKIFEKLEKKSSFSCVSFFVDPNFNLNGNFFNFYLSQNGVKCWKEQFWVPLR